VAAVNAAQEEKKKKSKSVVEEAPVKVEKVSPVQIEGGEEKYAVSLDDETVESLLTPEGKISFEQIGKLIGQSWKKVDPVRLEKYSELAKQDRHRYKQEMDAFNLKQNVRELRKQEQDYGSFGSFSSDVEPFRPAKVARAGDMSSNISYSYPQMPGASAFPNFMPPDQPFDSYENYPYATSQQYPMYYPPNYPGYGMAPSQRARGAFMPTTRNVPVLGQYQTYGREPYASTSSDAYRGSMMGGGGHNYR
jgi:hypothetical protein